VLLSSRSYVGQSVKHLLKTCDKRKCKKRLKEGESGDLLFTPRIGVIKNNGLSVRFETPPQVLLSQFGPKCKFEQIWFTNEHPAVYKPTEIEAFTPNLPPSY
jgi:hypothetical protein